MLQLSRRMKTFGVVASTLALFSLAGCGTDTKQSGADGVTWTAELDGKDYTFTMKEAPKRAVSMSQATAEMMLALGLEDRMVGTAFKEEPIYEPLQNAYDKVPVLAEKWPSYETFMAAKPDFTTGWADSFTKRAIPAAQLVSQDVNIFIPASMTKRDATLDTLFDDMLMFGKIFHIEERAQQWVNDEKAKLQPVMDEARGKEVKRVFIFDSEDEQPFTVFKGYTTNVLDLVGIHNVMADTDVDRTWAKASWESVVDANPDYIIICDYGNSMRNTDDFDAKVERLKSNPALANVNAVVNNRFIRVKLSEITPGVRTVDALTRIRAEMDAM